MIFSTSKALSFLLGAALVISPVLGANSTRPNPCGTVVTDEDIANSAEAINKIKNHRRQTGVQQYTFDVYWNSIAANMTTAGGWVPQSQIDDQMALINKRYSDAGTGVTWNLVNVTRVLSKYWFETVDAGLIRTEQMHTLLKKGGAASLSVYSVGFYDLGLNGYSTLPVNYARDPVVDGIVLLYSTVPGGTSRDRQGGTLIHEAGHWLGLRHTFQGGCTGSGDGVDDTPPSAEASYGCPIGLDSCTGDNEPDPIHNYMDYTDETCRTEFTPGQVELMQQSIQAFRS